MFQIDGVLLCLCGYQIWCQNRIGHVTVIVKQFLRFCHVSLNLTLRLLLPRYNVICLNSQAQGNLLAPESCTGENLIEMY